MSNPMVNILAKKFIQRHDVKAIQTSSGAYFPVLDNNKSYMPIVRADLEAHLAGHVSYGHYLIDTNNMTKLFAFDIDLEKNKVDANGNTTWSGSYPVFPDMTNYPGAPGGEDEYYRANTVIHQIDAREAWRDRAHPARPWLKYQLRMVGDKLARIIHETLEYPTVMAYSGSKGVHVYAFTGTIESDVAREMALNVISLTGEFEPNLGDSFYKHVNQDDVTGFRNVGIEVFPKQMNVNKNRPLGNLLRLPLGRNMKSADPTFFVDQRKPMNQLVPHPDPIALLETGNPWS